MWVFFFYIFSFKASILLIILNFEFKPLMGMAKFEIFEC